MMKKFKTINKHQELLDRLNELYQKGIDNKADAERNALININFINGKQYLSYDRKTNLIKEIDFEDEQLYRERGVFNRIRPLRNTIIGKVQNKIPMPQVVPITQDVEDLDIAKATNGMLSDLYRRQHLADMLNKSAKDMIDVGPSFIYVGWDRNAGHTMIDDVEAMLGDASGLISEEDKEAIRKSINSSTGIKSGDVTIERVPMFELIVADPFLENINDQPWVMRVRSYTKDDAQKLFGKDFRNLETINKIGVVFNNGSAYDNDNRELVNNLGVYNSQEVDEMVVVKEYFEKPNVQYPEGRHIIFGGEHIIEQHDEMPYLNGEYETRVYPFIKMGLDTPMLFYSHAFIEDIKEVQKRYNEVRNRKYEKITKNTHGQLIVYKDSLTDDTQITNKPGSILWMNRGYPAPSVVSSTGGDTMDVDSELRSLENEFISVMGISTLSTSGSPNSSAVRGAGMVQTLMETDDSKFSLIIEELANGIEEVCRHAIRLYKQFMHQDEVRFTKFVSGSETNIVWNKQILNENIAIKNRSSISKTDARRKEEVQMLLQSGLLSPEMTHLGPEMLTRLIEQLDLGVSLDEMPIKGYADVKKAREENRLITTQFAEIIADDIDDHAVHYEVHSNFIKSGAYRKLIISNPQIHQLMRNHLDMHRKVVEAQQQKARVEAEAQEAKKGK